METRKKPSKRYGQLIQSPTTGLSEMLMRHKEEVFKWIEERADVMDESGTEPQQQQQQQASGPEQVGQS